VLLTHCQRELMHQVWRLMLDDKFIQIHTCLSAWHCH
jgi:hypothetical protein